MDCLIHAAIDPRWRNRAFSGLMGDVPTSRLRESRLLLRAMVTSGGTRDGRSDGTIKAGSDEQRRQSRSGAQYRDRIESFGQADKPIRQPTTEEELQRLRLAAERSINGSQM